MEEPTDQQSKTSTQSIPPTSTPHEGPHHALTLPEIIRTILEFLNDDEDALQAAVRVNRTWAEEGTSVLWQEPNISSLAAIPGDRRQYYANKVQILEFGAEDERYHADFVGLAFPRLKRFAIHDGTEIAHFDHYFASGIEHFHVEMELPIKDYLSELGQTCTRLRFIWLCHRFEGICPDRFINFLQNCKNLERIFLDERMNELVSDDVLGYLAGPPHLKPFCTGRIITARAIRSIFLRIWPESPFQALAELDASVESEGLVLLAPVVPLIEVVTIWLEGTHREIFQAIGILTKLKSLDLDSQAEFILSETDMLALGNLHGLQRLQIFKGDTVTLADSVTGEHITQFLSNFPDLTCIQLGGLWEHDLPSSALVTLSKRSPKLKTCWLPGILDPAPLAAIESLLFPRMLSFHVGILTARSVLGERTERRSAKIGEFAETVAEHFPQLRCFSGTRMDVDYQRSKWNMELVFAKSKKE